jgi:hypothetical protein
MIIPRTAAEMLPWALEAHTRFTKSKALRDLARAGHGFAKELAEEALPMARFAWRYFRESKEVLITHVLGNQQYDGNVDDKRAAPSHIRYIEVTDSTRDHNEALRNELLSRDGTAPGVGKVHAEGPKGRRTRLEGEYAMRDVGAEPTQQLERVHEVVKAKAAKTYPSGTALVVHVDDAIVFKDAGAVAAVRKLAEDVLVPLLSGREFRVLVIEGSTHLYEAFELP